jgi:hypothetical protein
MTALEALLGYQQADEDGVMVLVSRQAIHEVANELKRARANAEYWRLAAERRDNRRGLTGLDVPEARTLDAPETRLIDAAPDLLAALTIAQAQGEDRQAFRIKYRCRSMPPLRRPSHDRPEASSTAGNGVALSTMPQQQYWSWLLFH